MIKCSTIGMYAVHKNNPRIVADEAVKNYSFMTVNDILYLIDNEINGDESYMHDVAIPAGEYLRGYQVDAWVGHELVIDGKHIEGGAKDLSKDDVLVVSGYGLAKGEAAGIHFVVTEKTTLTEAAVKARVCMA